MPVADPECAGSSRLPAGQFRLRRSGIRSAHVREPVCDGNVSSTPGAPPVAPGTPTARAAPGRLLPGRAAPGRRLPSRAAPGRRCRAGLRRDGVRRPGAAAGKLCLAGLAPGRRLGRVGPGCAGKASAVASSAAAAVAPPLRHPLLGDLADLRLHGSILSWYFLRSACRSAGRPCPPRSARAARPCRSAGRPSPRPVRPASSPCPGSPFRVSSTWQAGPATGASLIGQEVRVIDMPGLDPRPPPRSGVRLRAPALQVLTEPRAPSRSGGGPPRGLRPPRRRQAAAAPDRPVLPDITTDERDARLGRPARAGGRRSLLREVPPHHGG